MIGRQVTMIDNDEWDELVIKTYGRPYCLQQQDGCRDRGTILITVPNEFAIDYENDTVPEKVNDAEMGVSFKAWLERDPQQPLNSPDKWDREHGLEMWWHRNFYPYEDAVANDLHARGLLPAGEYVINIDW